MFYEIIIDQEWYLDISNFEDVCSEVSLKFLAPLNSSDVESRKQKSLCPIMSYFLQK